MTYEEYYGENYYTLKQIEKELLEKVRNYPGQEDPEGVQPILYCKSRIKSPESMKAKLKKQGLPQDSITALKQMHDAVGLRIVCSFVDNVYEIAEWLCCQDEFDVIEKKDYIAWPKPNGYRSLHLILSMKREEEKRIQAEIQIRTIAIDFWAALEHQMKYKHQVEHEKMMQDELKRCADEIASVDMSMQIIRDFIHGETKKDGECR